MENKQEKYEIHNSSIVDLKANIMVLIAWWGAVLVGMVFKVGYLSFIIPLLILLLEKDSQLVRSHAGQSLAVNIVSSAFALIAVAVGALAFGASLSFSLGVGAILVGLITLLTGIVSIVILVFSIIASIKGFNWEDYEIPVIGKFGSAITEKVQVK